MIKKFMIIVIALLCINFTKVRAIEIIDTKDIEDFSKYSKIYVPQEYINEQWNYYLNSNNNLTIITNNQCYTQYNTTYCNCYLYNIENNIMSDTYQCNTNNNNMKVSYSNITNDISYSNRIFERFKSDKLIKLLMLGVAILFITWLTKERKKL